MIVVVIQIIILLLFSWRRFGFDNEDDDVWSRSATLLDVDAWLSTELGCASTRRAAPTPSCSERQQPLCDSFNIDHSLFFVRIIASCVFKDVVAEHIKGGHG
jgi:hypothetical protein